MAVLPSPTSDGAVKATFIVVRCRCCVMLTTVLPSHASKGTAEVI
jgi:hypothetical protein